jgi:hypothetical protein
VAAHRLISYAWEAWPSFPIMRVSNVNSEAIFRSPAEVALRQRIRVVVAVVLVLSTLAS